jgi:S1-C subfamily serine protease
VSIQPRSAGSPLVDEKGKVVGILTATRDDPLGRLPVVAIDLIRKFASGKFTAVTEAATIIPDNSVLELSATREE